MSTPNKLKPFDDFGGPLQQCAMPLIAKIDDEFIPLGTGFAINPNGLIITAAHVLEAAYALASRRLSSEGAYYDHYEFYALYASDDPIPNSTSTVGGLLPIDRVWAPRELDIGFAWLRLPRNASTNELLRLYTVTLRPAPPQPGEPVHAVGYYGMVVEPRSEGYDLCYAHETAHSTGRVLEVHPEYRDRGLLNFPCLRTDAVFAHGMSGGPIFDSTGCVVGVVCSSDSTQENSYGSLIWPVFGCQIDIQDGSTGTVRKKLLYDIAAEGGIKTDDSFRWVTVTVDEVGKRTVRLNCPI
jgi:hypothetical protein